MCLYTMLRNLYRYIALACSPYRMQRIWQYGLLTVNNIIIVDINNGLVLVMNEVLQRCNDCRTQSTRQFSCVVILNVFIVNGERFVVSESIICRVYLHAPFLPFLIGRKVYRLCAWVLSNDFIKVISRPGLLFWLLLTTILWWHFNKTNKVLLRNNIL